MGMAASAGQFLLTTGTPGKRAALPHARILLHQGSAGIGGTAVDVELQADDLRRTRDTVLGLIAERTGQPIERVRQDSLRDRWYTAEQSVDYGFIDRVAHRFDELFPVEPRAVAGLGVPA
jgi:ATP-dependent Clp protease protease subunit